MRRVTVLLLLAALSVAGCGSGSTHPPASTRNASSPSLTAPDSASPTLTSPPPQPQPAVVSWGTTGQLLSVVVTNPSTLEVVVAHVTITALDATGAALLTVAGSDSSKGSTILALPPGKRFGLFADIGTLGAQVKAISVQYRDVRFAPWNERDASVVSISDPVFGTDPNGDAVVTVTLAAAEPVTGYVVGQAFLTDPSGKLVGVVSGRFYCLSDRTVLRRRMQFLHPVPPETRVAAVLAYPVPAGQPSGVPYACPKS